MSKLIPKHQAGKKIEWLKTGQPAPQTLKQIIDNTTAAQIVDNAKKRYGSNDESTVEGALAAASFHPSVYGYAASVAGSGIDAYDSFQAFKRGDTGEGTIEVGQALLGLIPFSKYAKPYIQLSKNAKVISKANTVRKVAQTGKAVSAGSDVLDIASPGLK